MSIPHGQKQCDTHLILRKGHPHVVVEAMVKEINRLAPEVRQAAVSHGSDAEPAGVHKEDETEHEKPRHGMARSTTCRLRGFAGFAGAAWVATVSVGTAIAIAIASRPIASQ